MCCCRAPTALARRRPAARPTGCDHPQQQVAESLLVIDIGQRTPAIREGHLEVLTACEHLARAQECRERLRDPLGDGRTALLLGLELMPAGLDMLRRRHALVRRREDVRVTALQLVGDGVGDVIEGEQPLFLGRDVQEDHGAFRRRAVLEGAGHFDQAEAGTWAEATEQLRTVAGGAEQGLDIIDQRRRYVHALGGLLHLAAYWQVPSSSLVMVGDYRYDLECARQAGACAVLVNLPENPWPQLTDLHAGSCGELLALL